MTGGVSAAYAVDLVAFTSVVYAMWRLRPIKPEGATPTKAGWAAVRDGITFLKHKKNLQMSFYVDIAAMVFGMPRALFPAIAAGMYPNDPRMAQPLSPALRRAGRRGRVSGVLSGTAGPRETAGARGRPVGVRVGTVDRRLRAGELAAARVPVPRGRGRGRQRERRLPLDDPPGRHAGRLPWAPAGHLHRRGGGRPTPRRRRVGHGGRAVRRDVLGRSGGIACIAVTGVLVAAMPAFLRYDGRHPVP